MQDIYQEIVATVVNEPSLAPLGGLLTTTQVQLAKSSAEYARYFCNALLSSRVKSILDFRSPHTPALSHISYDFPSDLDVVASVVSIVKSRRLEAITSPEPWLRDLSTHLDQIDEHIKASKLFADLWLQYSIHNSEAVKIHKLFLNNGEIVRNDHIALRAFNVPNLNLESLSIPFIEVGYEIKGDYEFPDKHLVAKHLEHKTNPKAPKIFISELKVEYLSQSAQDIINKCIQSIDFNKITKLVTSGRLWGEISFKNYELLRSESEYAAWMYVWGFMPNHFTVKVNELSTFKTIEQVNDFIEQEGFAINSIGGKVKGTPSDLLQQSATLAEKRNVIFTEGVFEIPCCFYEFALRYNKPDGTEYSGFITANADKIFESTNKR